MSVSLTKFEILKSDNTEKIDYVDIRKEFSETDIFLGSSIISYLLPDTIVTPLSVIKMRISDHDLGLFKEEIYIQYIGYKTIKVYFRNKILFNITDLFYSGYIRLDDNKININPLEFYPYSDNRHEIKFKLINENKLVNSSLFKDNLSYKIKIIGNLIETISIFYNKGKIYTTKSVFENERSVSILENSILNKLYLV